jgi:pimeloyl-ACP methyl ester carboxylesterase
MSITHSADGTTIGFNRVGTGPTVVIVDGALCYRAFGPSAKIAAQLASHFTVVTYDRRGRGESGDTRPYAPEREVEDLAAVIDAVGGSADVVTLSSGGALALDAAARLTTIRRLAVYEVPFVVDATGNTMPGDFVERLEALVAEDRRGDAVRLFMRHVGTPAPAVALMRLLPLWRKLTAVAPTLPYDMGLVRDHSDGRPLPPGRFAAACIPVLALAGGASPEWMRITARAIAAAVPDGRYETLAGQNHMVKPAALAPAIRAFLAAPSAPVAERPVAGAV